MGAIGSALAHPLASQPLCINFSYQSRQTCPFLRDAAFAFHRLCVASRRGRPRRRGGFRVSLLARPHHRPRGEAEGFTAPGRRCGRAVARRRREASAAALGRRAATEPRRRLRRVTWGVSRRPKRRRLVAVLPQIFARPYCTVCRCTAFQTTTRLVRRFAARLAAQSIVAFSEEPLRGSSP